jgi:hypothetical protein
VSINACVLSAPVLSRAQSEPRIPRRILKARGEGPEGWKLEDADLYHLAAGKLTRLEYLALAFQHLAQFPRGGSYSPASMNGKSGRSSGAPLQIFQLSPALSFGVAL